MGTDEMKLEGRILGADRKRQEKRALLVGAKLEEMV